MGFVIRVENSAPSQRRSAQAVVWSAPLLHELGVRKVADFGCGRLRNLTVLQQYFNKITLVDTEYQCNRINSMISKERLVTLVTNKKFKESTSKYEAIFLISVLHIIPSAQTRVNVLKIIHSKLVKSGYLVIDVPNSETYYLRQCTDANKYRDGWIMGKGSVRTFYKNYHADELDALVKKAAPFEQLARNTQIKHITRIWKKLS